MICKKCGAELPEGLKFCTNCGEKLELPVPETIAEPEEIPAEAEPAVSEPEQETPVPEPIQEPEPAKEAEPVSKAADPGKKKRNPLLFVLLAAVIAAAGWFGYQQLPSTKLAKAMKAAEQYTAQENYDGAVTEYMKALELKPQTDEISEPAAAALKMKSRKQADAGQFEEAVKTAEAALDLLSKKSRGELTEHIEELYRDEAYSFANENDFQAAKGVLQTGMDKGYDLKEYLSEIEFLEEEYTERTYLQSVLKSSAGAIDQGDYDSVYALLISNLSDMAHYQKNYGMDYPILYKTENGKFDQIGLYYTQNQFLIYYGEYESGKRNGTGIYLTAWNNSEGKMSRKYRAEGEWKDDFPNGKVTEYSFIVRKNAETVLQTQTKNGIFDGDIVYQSDGKTYYGTFKDGIMETTEVNTAAGKVKAVLHTENNHEYVYFNDESYYDRVYGMPGYGEGF